MGFIESSQLLPSTGTVLWSPAVHFGGRYVGIWLHFTGGVWAVFPFPGVLFAVAVYGQKSVFYGDIDDDCPPGQPIISIRSILTHGEVLV